MGSVIEQVDLSRDSEAPSHSGVTCIFCGLPTPVRVTSQKVLATYPPRPSSRVSIVRCEICGKEAPYLSEEVADFGEVFRERRVSLSVKEYGI